MVPWEDDPVSQGILTRCLRRCEGWNINFRLCIVFSLSSGSDSFFYRLTLHFSSSLTFFFASHLFRPTRKNLLPRNSDAGLYCRVRKCSPADNSESMKFARGSCTTQFTSQSRQTESFLNYFLSFIIYAWTSLQF